MNAITNFAQFHQALTSIANSPAIGVVPTGIKGFPAFAAIGDPSVKPPSPVQIDFSRPQAELDAQAFVIQHDDSELLDGIHQIQNVLAATFGDLLPDNEFFGRPVTAIQAKRRNQIKKLVTPAGARFSDMTVKDVAKRLATESRSEGDGRGRTGHIDHVDLVIDALFDRSRAVRENIVNLDDHLLAAGILLANIGSLPAPAMAEFALGEAAVHRVSDVFDYSKVSAAILYGLAADMRDARCTNGVERDNPIRANAAANWFSSVDGINTDKIGARIFFGMSEALRAGDYSLYAAFALAGARMPRSKIDDRIGMRHRVRYLWATSEDLNSRGKNAEIDEDFWNAMEDYLLDAGRYFQLNPDSMTLAAECLALGTAAKSLRGV